MTLTPTQAAGLRAKLLADLDSGEDFVAIDSRFIPWLFPRTPDCAHPETIMTRWCKSWHIKFETYNLTHGAVAIPPVWVRFWRETLIEGEDQDL